MIKFLHKDVLHPLHYRAEKLFAQEIWKVTVTIQDQVFTRASTDKDLFRKLSDLNCFYEIQEELHEAFFQSFKPEIINYLNNDDPRIQEEG
jgi:hypothetical protein